MTPALLNQSPAQAPEEIIEKYLDLPSISPRIVAEARRIVANASTPYERALALQNHFRTNYRYDIKAGAGHDERTLETFLFQSKSGYCEQFAGAYAVLARLIGLPARVAVGFTPGVLDEGAGVYRVKGGHGHATGHTGLQPDQDDTLAEAAAAADTTTTLPAGQEPNETPTTLPESAEDGQALPTGPEDEPGLPGVVNLLLVVIGLVALWAIVVPTLHARRRRERRRRPGSAAKVLADWTDTAEVLGAAGVSRRPAETMTEYAGRAAQSAGLQPEPSQALRRLAGDASVAAYADVDVPEEVASRANGDAARVRTAVFDQVSMASRLGWWLDPRPLIDRDRRA
jgi:hypothetical protein